MDFKKIDVYLTKLAGCEKDLQDNNSLVAYSINNQLFAMMPINKDPVRLSLRADQQLASLLRSKYESVMPASGLNPKQWNTIILSGQLSWEEVQSLIRHSYDLAKKAT